MFEVANVQISDTMIRVYATLISGLELEEDLGLVQYCKIVI